MPWERHGQELDTLWQAQFGYGIDCLTDIEAQNLCRQPSAAAIEDFLAQAAIEARGRGLEPATGGGWLTACAIARKSGRSTNPFGGTRCCTGAFSPSDFLQTKGRRLLQPLLEGPL